MTSPDDLIAQSRTLDERLAHARAFRWAGAAGITAILLLVVVVVLDIRDLGEDVEEVTTSTNKAVQEENVRLAAENAEMEDLLNQSTDAIVLLITTLQDNGITPPEIVIRATTTTTEAPDG